MKMLTRADFNQSNSFASDSERDGWLARGVFYGLLGLIAWVPLPLASNRPWSWSLLSLIVGCLLIVWSIAVISRPDLMRLSWRRWIWVGALFGAAAFWAFAQTLGVTPDSLHDPMWETAGRTLGKTIGGTISADPAASIGGLMRLIAYGGVFWLAAQYARHPACARQIIWCIVLVGIAYAAYGIAVFSAGNHTILWYDRWAYTDDLTSTFVSRSAFGAFAGIALLAALALVLHIAEQSPHGKPEGQRSFIDLLDALPAKFYFLIAGCFVLATALVLSHSRGAVAVSALGVGAMLSAMIFRHKGRRRQLVFISLVILMASAIVLQLSGRVTLGRVLQLSEQGTGRDAIHSLTRRGIDAAPITGRGLDTFRHLYFRYRNSSIPWDSPRYDKAHNTYLELVLELGWVGFILLMGAILLIIGTILSGIVRRRRDTIYPIVGLGTTVLIGTHSMLDFSVQMPAIAVIYSAILGVAFAQSWRSDRPLSAAATADN
jgi:O-antigen ligase